MSAVEARVDSSCDDVPQPNAFVTPTSATTALMPNNLDVIPRTLRRRNERAWNVAGADPPATKKPDRDDDPARAHLSRDARFARALHAARHERLVASRLLSRSGSAWTATLLSRRIAVSLGIWPQA